MVLLAFGTGHCGMCDANVGSSVVFYAFLPFVDELFEYYFDLSKTQECATCANLVKCNYLLHQFSTIFLHRCD